MSVVGCHVIDIGFLGEGDRPSNAEGSLCKRLAS
jgi:hypothetical protein